MTQAFASQLNSKIQKTNIKAQKIGNTTLEIYKIVVSTFSILDKDDKERFFERSFLLVDIKSDKVFEMLFLIISNTNVDFQAQN